MQNVFDLTGKIMAVTAAHKGLGRVFARALAAAGATVIGIARREDEIARVGEEIREQGGVFSHYVADITDEESIKSVVARTMEEHGRIDALVNNAGMGRINTAPEEMDVEVYRSLVDNNLVGTFICCKYFGREMIRQKRGKIVNLASMSGIICNRGVHCGAYEVSKLGIVALSRSLAAEWAPHNIQVNALAPGYFETDRNRNFFAKNPEFAEAARTLIPTGRFGDENELGGVMVFLCSEASNYMTGQTMIVDGGYTVW